jgi:hypothetical protein
MCSDKMIMSIITTTLFVERNIVYILTVRVALYACVIIVIIHWAVVYMKVQWMTLHYVLAEGRVAYRPAAHNPYTYNWQPRSSRTRTAIMQDLGNADWQAPISHLHSYFDWFMFWCCCCSVYHLAFLPKTCANAINKL